MYSMNGLGQTAADAEAVRAAIRRARGSGYGGWQQYETRQLQELLNSLLPAGTTPISDSGVYDGQQLCAAVDAIFGTGTATSTSLKNEIGAACMGYYPPLTRTGSMANEQLIIFDEEDEATPTPITSGPTRPSKLLGDYCDVPAGLCFESQAVANAVKPVVEQSCNYLLQFTNLPPQVKGYSTNGLGVACAPPGTNKITYQNLSYFISNYNPCQLKNLGVCPPAPPTPFTPCPAGDRACIDSRSPDILDTAQTQCQFNVVPRGDASACPPPNGLITHANMHRYDPCELAQVPMCLESDPNIPITPFAEPPPEAEEEEEDNTKFIVGGILGLLILGGIGYAATRKRRKKGKRRK